MQLCIRLSQNFWHFQNGTKNIYLFSISFYAKSSEHALFQDTQTCEQTRAAKLTKWSSNQCCTVNTETLVQVTRTERHTINL